MTQHQSVLAHTSMMELALPALTPPFPGNDVAGFAVRFWRVAWPGGQRHRMGMLAVLAVKRLSDVQDKQKNVNREHMCSCRKVEILQAACACLELKTSQ